MWGSGPTRFVSLDESGFPWWRVHGRPLHTQSPPPGLTTGVSHSRRVPDLLSTRVVTCIDPSARRVLGPRPDIGHRSVTSCVSELRPALNPMGLTVSSVEEDPSRLQRPGCVGGRIWEGRESHRTTPEGSLSGRPWSTVRGLAQDGGCRRVCPSRVRTTTTVSLASQTREDVLESRKPDVLEYEVSLRVL